MTARQVNETRFAQWATAYREALPEAVAKWPAEYPWAANRPEQVAITVAKMLLAFHGGSYNHGGHGIALTCKKLGLRHTRKAIEAFLTGPEVPT